MSEASDRDVEIVREALMPEPSTTDVEEWSIPDTEAIAALARLTERLEALEKERDELRRRVDDNWDQSAYDVCCDTRDEAELRVRELEKERDRLQHFIECADTPLMRDVLQRVRELEEALEAAERELREAREDWRAIRHESEQRVSELEEALEDECREAEHRAATWPEEYSLLVSVDAIRAALREGAPVTNLDSGSE